MSSTASTSVGAATSFISVLEEAGIPIATATATGSDDNTGDDDGFDGSSAVAAATATGGGTEDGQVQSASSSTFVTSFSTSSTSSVPSTGGALINDGFTQGGEAQDQQGDSGLSTGAAAGVGAGVTLAVVALVGGILFMLWRRRRNGGGRRERDARRLSDGHEVQVVEPKYEKDGVERMEAPDTGQPTEIDGRSRAELEGDLRAVEVGGKP